MENYLNVANNWVFYVCAVVIILFVLFQACLFFMHAFREGLKCGLTRAQMYKAFRTGVLSSVIPSVAAVVALVAMVPVLGLPIPWVRQVIMGSTPYELMAAGIGAKSMGIDSLGGQGYTAQVFASSIWVMTLGSIWAVAIIVFLLKTIKKRYTRLSGDDPRWKQILVNASFLGVFSIFIAEPVTTGGIPLITLAAGGVFMIIFALVITKLKLDWLKEFALTFSMLGAMVCAAVFSNIL